LQLARVKQDYMGLVCFNRELIDKWASDERARIKHEGERLKNAISLPDKSINEGREALQDRELLTGKEAAVYLDFSAETSLYRLMSKGDTLISSAIVKQYGRTFFKRSVLDQWLAEREQRDRECICYPYIVTKKSTGECFIVQAQSATRARWQVCSYHGAGEAGIKDYSAKLINEAKGVDTNA